MEAGIHFQFWKGNTAAMAVPALEVDKKTSGGSKVLAPYVREGYREATAPKRILFVDHTASLGGGEMALLNLVRHLDTTRFKPIVLLFSEGRLADLFREAGVDTHVLPLASSVIHTRKDSLSGGSLLRVKDIGRTVAHVFRVAQFMRMHKVHLVHTNSLKADVIGGLAARLARKPVIWHVRDRISDDYLPKPVVTLFRGLCRTIPTCVVANSGATLATVSHPAMKRSAVVYSGINVDEIPSSPAPSEYSMPQIGMVGRISPWKGQDVFLRAAAEVRKQFPCARFKIIGSALFGEAEYDREVRELCTGLGLDDCVEFAGFRDDVPQLIAGLDILVHASVTAEPFGRVVVEGMAAGKPVVATNGGGIPEIVEDGRTGHLVPMSDPRSMAVAISRILEDPAAAREMGVRARQRVIGHFTIEKAARKIEGIYDDLLGWSRPRVASAHTEMAESSSAA
jgi:glycosyltransferase involved in cell wall biosynthesis